MTCKGSLSIWKAHPPERVMPVPGPIIVPARRIPLELSALPRLVRTPLDVFLI